MEVLNPIVITESPGIHVFPIGELNTNISKRNIDKTSNHILNDFEKKELLKKVAEFELSEDVKYFVDEYERVFDKRDRFIWNWLGVIFKETNVTLSTVDKNLTNSIIEDKILISMIDCIIDDVAEFSKDIELTNAMIDVLINPRNLKDFEHNEKLLLLDKMWKFLLSKMSKYPRFEEFIDIFIYDLKQVLNCCNYSYLINKNPEIMNILEMETYDCHNMIVYLLNGIDLMASPHIDKKDLPHLRTAFWYAQQMARIGNWLSTWKREIKERDFSSGVFAYVFSNKILDFSDINTLSDDEIINRIENSGMNEYFMNLWKENYVKLASVGKMIQSVDMDTYLDGLKNVIKYHLASEGLK